MTDDDINMDEIMGLVETMPDEITPDEVTKIEEEEQYEAPKEVARESNDTKMMYEALNANARLQEEVQSLRSAKEQAESLALQGVLRSFETQIDSVAGDNSRLKQELIRARDDGDTAAGVEIENQIRENFERMRDLKGKVEHYAPMLNAPRQTEQPRQAERNNELAAQWVRDNEAWLTDPKFVDKRDHANRLFQDLQTAQADMSSLSFWTKLEKGISEFEHTKRFSEDSKQHRMPKNMVTYNSNGSNSPSKKPVSYKDDREFVQSFARLAKDVIKNEDILKDKKFLNSALRQYHKVWKDGAAKHWPSTLN